MEKKKIIAITALIGLIFITNISYGYFASKVSINSSKGNKVDKLYITNGDSKVEIDTSNSSWKYDDSSSVGTSVVNPDDGVGVNYEGVK